MQHCLYFLSLPQGQGAFRESFVVGIATSYEVETISLKKYLRQRFLGNNVTCHPYLPDY